MFKTVFESERVNAQRLTRLVRYTGTNRYKRFVVSAGLLVVGQ